MPSLEAKNKKKQIIIIILNESDMIYEYGCSYLQADFCNVEDKLHCGTCITNGQMEKPDPVRLVNAADSRQPKAKLALSSIAVGNHSVQK